LAALTGPLHLLTFLETRLRSLTPAEAALCRVAFRRLLAGWPTFVDDLGAELGLDRAAVARTLGDLAERGSVTVSADDGEVLTVRGLSRAETPHRLRLGDRWVHVCCAVDAVGIPAALGLDAEVESACHACGAPVTLSFVAGALLHGQDAPLVWGADPDPGRSVRAFT
jgi:alkylmercury lyase